MSTYTTNKGLEQPAAGSYNNAWATPVNQDWADIDNALGGLTTISVTGVAPGVYTLALSQYQPPNIAFTGMLSANLVYALPVGVGGIWSVFNNTSGGFSLTFASNGGGAQVVAQGQRLLLVCDGTNVQYADGQAYTAAGSAQAAAEAFATVAANNAISTSEAFATAADAVVLSTAESFATAAANTAQSTAESFATTAANTAQSTAESFATTAANNAQTAAISTSEAFATAADTTVLSTAETFATTLVAKTIRSGTFNCINGTVTVTFSPSFVTACSAVTVTWNYAGADVGTVTAGSVSASGFQYTNGNAGACYYIAIGD